jgi:hypothetical protein
MAKFVDPLNKLETEYSIKETDELPIRALVAMAVYCQNTKSVTLSLSKVAQIIAYLLIIEAQASGRDIDVDRTLAQFTNLVKETLLRLKEQEEPLSSVLH